MRFLFSMMVIAVCLPLIVTPQVLSMETEPSVPSYKLNRADEDYRYLQNPVRRGPTSGTRSSTYPSTIAAIYI